MADDVVKFIETLAASLRDDTFIKLTLGNYKGTDEGLQKIIACPVDTKRGPKLSFTYRYHTRDVVKNYEPAKVAKIIEDALDIGFRAAHLSTRNKELELVTSKKGKTHLSSKPASGAPADAAHDRQKQRPIDVTSAWLRSLGITTANGDVRASQQNKWRQINKFVEIVASLIDNSRLKDKNELRVVDMGSGKGYLTFALYDYLTTTRGIDVSITGVDARKELVELCNKIAGESGFTRLDFVSGTIDSYDATGVDILIALHACDTATDDAIFKGIRASTDIIVAAPCCHKELRPQVEAPSMLRDVLKHGVLLERTAETLTDGIRSLLLEREGYKTKMIEFVPVEHTPKNNMLVGTRAARPADPARFQSEIDEIKAAFKIDEQRLEALLAKRISQ